MNTEELLTRLVAAGSLQVDIPAMTLEFLLEEGGIAARAVPPGQHPPIEFSAGRPRAIWRSATGSGMPRGTCRDRGGDRGSAPVTAPEPIAPIARISSYQPPGGFPTMSTCSVCSAPLTGRPDRTTCSDRCRQRARRARQAGDPPRPAPGVHPDPSDASGAVVAVTCPHGRRACPVIVRTCEGCGRTDEVLAHDQPDLRELVSRLRPLSTDGTRWQLTDFTCSPGCARLVALRSALQLEWWGGEG